MLKEKEPFIAIILVNYNGLTDTVECIDSILQMTYRNYKIIVVDNKSTDDSVKNLREKQLSAEFELIECKKNLGFSAGNNVGIQYAIEMGVEYVLLLNNDTIVDRGFLKTLIKRTIELPHDSVTTGTIYYSANRKMIWYGGGGFNKKTGKVSHFGFKRLNFKLPEKTVEVTFISGCCMCIPISVIKRVGLLDEIYFLYEEDMDYCYRLQNEGVKLFYIPDAILYHKVSSSTTKMNHMSGTTQYYMVRNKFFFIKKYYTGFRKIKPYCYSFAMYCYYCIRYGMNIKYVAMGIHDFLNKKMMKTDRKL